jgi:hypothetical protein
MLVEYADQELDSNDAFAVRVHLEDCLACRAALLRLDTSLELCHEIWNERGDAERRSKAITKSQLKSTLVRAAAALAATLLLAVSMWPLRPHDEVINAAATTSQSDELREDTVAADTISTNHITIDVELVISRATMAARLEAASAVLATNPALTEYRERADRLLATTFADLEAGQRAKARLNSSDNSYQ